MNAPDEVAESRSSRFPMPPTFDRVAARAIFDLELERLDLLIHLEILRMRARYELTLDEFRGLYISDQQVDELVRHMHRDTDSGMAQDLAAKAQALLERVVAESDAHAFAVETPWQAIWTRLQLSRLERDLLLLAFAPELDAKYDTLYAYLNNDVTRRLPTADLASRLFADDVGQRIETRGLLSPNSRLTRNGFIEFSPAYRDAPRAQRGFRVAPPLVDWLLGLPYCDERLAGVAELLSIDDHRVGTRTSADVAAHPIARAVMADGPTPSFVYLGSTAEEAAASARDVVCQAGGDVLRVDLAALRSTSAPNDVCAAVGLMASVFGAGIVAAPVDALFDPEGRVLEAPAVAARRLMEQAPYVIWAGSDHARWRDALGNVADTLRVVRLHELDTLARMRTWRETLGTHAEQVDIQALADRFVFGADRIARTVRHALDRAAFEHTPLSQTLLFEAARSISSERVLGVTRTTESPFTWDDLVLPSVVKRRLQDVVSAIALRPRVLDEWGFAARMGNARGVKVMFAGVSGTGKTMAAAIVAKTLSVDTHRVDLAAVVSKYIGETEKNLDRAFDAARRANAILFIDEADALFGKRSEVKDAHDRYANVETAYLLQKMEDHDGVVILATNLANNIDEAFSRRMHFVIDFPMPDVPSRKRLWSGMFPRHAPLADDVDFDFLARQFVFAGGDIRNVVLDGAYLAAQEGNPIGMRHLLTAVARQYAKRGKVPTAAEFREYFGMLAQGVATPCSTAS